MASPRRVKWGFGVAGVFFIALVIWAIMAAHKPASAAKPTAVAVTIAKTARQDVPIVVSALGAAQAWQNVVINPQVNGRLTFVAAEGTDIAAGAVIAEIDPGAYRAALTQAEGALARDEAMLQAARANLARFQLLAQQDSIARQQVDDQAALVKQDEGTVRLDEGAVAAAKVNLNYCRIRSPMSGRVGVRLIDPGNIVTTTTTTGIVTVDQIAPIAVTFTVPQGDFQRLSNVSDGFRRPLPTQALSQETGAPLGEGELSIADNHVDQSTGTVRLKARFPNAGKQMWPGQFVNVNLTLQTLPGALTIPATAVNNGPDGPFAYVVGPDNKVSVRPLVVTATQGAVAVIQSGVRVGDTVVTDGQMSLRPGSSVATSRSAPMGKPAH